MVEFRRHRRTPVAFPVEFSVADSSGPRATGQATDLSLGGMFIQTTAPLAFSAELVVYLTLPAQKAKLELRGVVRWTGQNGMGVQFGLLGARETHAITEMTKLTS